MKKKISVLLLVLASLVVILPPASNAATSEKPASISIGNAEAQVTLRIGRQRRNRRWERNRRWNNRRTRVVRQTVWRNGRRVTIVRRVRY